VVSVSRRIVTDTIYVKDEPADVVFAAGKAFVSAARKNQIAVFDANTHAAVTTIPVFGENPRALTVNSNGTKSTPPSRFPETEPRWSRPTARRRNRRMACRP